MRSHYKIRNTLKNLSFYTEEINNTKFLSELPFFPKTTKILGNYQFQPKRRLILLKWLFMDVWLEHYKKKT